jgi:hypothetical protein
VTQREDIVWGVREFGNVTANLVFNYANLNLPANTSVNLLKRSDATSVWQNITVSAVHDAVNKTFTLSAVTDFCEFSIGSAPALSVDAPTNVAIQISGSNTQISWDTVTGATSYKVFASDTPDGTFTEVTSLGVIVRNGETRNRAVWSSDNTGLQRKFYHVTASNQ